MKLSFLSRWWKSVVLLGVCGIVAQCGGERSHPSLPRTTEAWLSGFEIWRKCTKRFPHAGAVVEVADCGPDNLPRELVSLAVSECDDRMSTATDAVQLLARVGPCTDAAVEKLEMFAGNGADAIVLSDLAGAYYVRAQRKDQPSDFVRSLAAADRAISRSPSLVRARFNRALAEEALGFTDDAIQAWDQLRKGTDQWAAEAGEHYERLLTKRSRTAATIWDLNRKRLPIVAAAGDRSAVKALIAPYPGTARRYVEEELLPSWAEAKSVEDAARHLALAEMIGMALSELGRDRYLLDSVQRIRDTRDSHVLALLKEGHVALEAGRALLVVNAGAAEKEFERAERALSAAGSPARFGAAFGRVAALTFGNRYDAAWNVLRAVERDARDRYPSVIGRVHTGRGHSLMVQGLSMHALAEYKKARAIFKNIKDSETAATAQTSIIGLYSRIGHEELAWRAVFEDRRWGADMVDVQSRHARYGESAGLAAELGYPAVALRYQNLAVKLIEDELSGAPQDRIDALRRNRGIALIHRAGIRLKLGDHTGARADLAEVAGLPFRADVAELQSGFRALIAEIDARALAETNRKAAIAALTQAIDVAADTRYRALVASLLMQRADLHRLEGNRVAMAADLEQVIAKLRAEEIAALQSRQESGAELLWSAFFSRGQEVYRRLTELSIELGADAKAFEYAERARAFEPLHLLLQRNNVPADFRKLVGTGTPLQLQDLEQILPAGTALLQYSVLDHGTYVWIVMQGRSHRLFLSVGEKQIRSWTRALQRFASLRDDTRFESALLDPYKALLAEPLAFVAKSSIRTGRLVIVPDRSMHGLPFAALRNGSRHLVEDYAVAVAGSATLYAFSLAQDKERSDDKTPAVRLFADPAFDAALGLTRARRLLSARNEVARIAALYSGVADVKPPVMDARATVSEFLRSAAVGTILHLAVHGVANHDVPQQSYLLFAPTANDDSGVIDAERLLKQLDLKRARLTVLSACSSAGGTPVGPEGLAPLVRPFIVAGVPAVVGTLWDVSDDTATENLLVQFHRHYRDGWAADEALRHAQIEMLRQGAPARPVRSWAAFQMIGYASSPFARDAIVRRTQ